MTSSKIFYNNTTQAVRLPKDVAFAQDVTEVEIFIQGETRVIAPKGRSLVAWMQTGPHFTEDFMVGHPTTVKRLLSRWVWLLANTPVTQRRKQPLRWWVFFPLSCSS